MKQSAKSELLSHIHMTPAYSEKLNIIKSPFLDVYCNYLIFNCIDQCNALILSLKSHRIHIPYSRVKKNQCCICMAHGKRPPITKIDVFRT